MTISKKELKNVKLSELIPYKKNPRINDPAVRNVRKSLEEYGYIKNSIVVDENLVLITGHTTLKAMQSLGWKDAPQVTQVTGLTEKQKKGYRIADNKTGELSEWDNTLLLDELEDLEGVFTGFEKEDIATLELDEIPYELDELLEELDIKNAIETPIWITIRAPEHLKSELEKALEDISSEAHIEKSYRKER